MITVRFSGLPLLYNEPVSKEKLPPKGETAMKGYFTHIGYMGYVEGRWVLFACEQDYFDYMED